jgi:AcrR family transcriptional regulator
MGKPLRADLAPGLSPETQERILTGAVRAVARHGVAKLGMSDVSSAAGVSRGTLYRYYPTRDDLLAALASREAERFLEQTLAAVDAVPPGEERLRVMLEHALHHVRAHPALRRLLDTEPALVLDSLRARFPEIRATVAAPLLPVLAESGPVRRGVVTVEQLADWTVRFLITLYLFDDPDPDGQAQALAAMFRLLNTPGDDA